MSQSDLENRMTELERKLDDHLRFHLEIAEGIIKSRELALKSRELALKNHEEWLKKHESTSNTTTTN